jgi:hypothetical protein
MTAAQVINAIKFMPKEVRAKIVEFVRQSDVTSAPTGVEEKRLDAISDKVFDRHVSLMRKLAQ